MKKQLVFNYIFILLSTTVFAQPFTGQDINPLRAVIGNNWSGTSSNWAISNFALSIYRDATGSAFSKPYPAVQFYTPNGGFNMGICMDAGQGYGLGSFYMKAEQNGSGTSRTTVYDFMNSSFPSYFRFGHSSNSFKTLVVSCYDRIGIGTDNFPKTLPVPNTADNYRLFVKGGIKAEEVKIELSSTGGWGDYVFDKGYNLMSLPVLKNYIAENKHLPGMPSAQELVDDGGIEMSKMIKMQQVKIEELTLYMIQQQKEIEELKKVVGEKRQ